MKNTSRFLMSAVGIAGIFALFVIGIVASAHTVSAHEVYVLNAGEVAHDTAEAPFDMIDVIRDDFAQFSFWAFITCLTIFCVFWISTVRRFERACDPFLLKLRRYAPAVARVTIGLSFLAGAYYQATYGPEMPLATYGSYAGLVTIALTAMGIMAVLGLYARVAALIGLVLFTVAVAMHGWYMLTYANYLGELIVLAILGSHSFSLDALFARTKSIAHQKPVASSGSHIMSRIRTYLAPQSFAILRVMFGISFIYASAYAKILHNNLALDTVTTYHLDKILGFEPHFLVLGAAIIELLIGIFFILGIEIRFTSVFMLFWLSLSLMFFGEAVWPHLILIGIPIALACYGYDRYSVEGYFFRKKKYEPVL